MGGPPNSFGTLLGLRELGLAPRRAAMGLTLGPEHMNPYGVVHGGVVYALADTAMGAAVWSTLEAGERCATLEIKINYLAPAGVGAALAVEATVLERTRRIAVLEARVRDEADRLIAVATGSFYISPDAR